MYKIGVLGAADIAYRMFVPALKQCSDFECVGVAEEYNIEKAEKFREDYQLDIFNRFDDLINDEKIYILYIPLPPALHYEYAKKALLKGKHVFLEKPLTTCLEDTEDLIRIAKERKLVLQENYMFQFHKQLEVVKDIIDSQKLGDLRLIRSCFSFPKRAANDFRYSQKLGGGALLDAGGYVVKLGSFLLDGNIQVENAHLYYIDDCDVDVYGDFVLSNQSITYQGAFGMDNHYSCSLEIYGSKGKLSTNRIFTSPPGNQPVIDVYVGNNHEEVIVDADNHFIKSILKFEEALKDDQIRECFYERLYQQSYLVGNIRKMGESQND